MFSPSTSYIVLNYDFHSFCKTFHVFTEVYLRDEAQFNGAKLDSYHFYDDLATHPRLKYQQEYINKYNDSMPLEQQVGEWKQCLHHWFFQTFSVSFHQGLSVQPIPSYGIGVMATKDINVNEVTRIIPGYLS